MSKTNNITFTPPFLKKKSRSQKKRSTVLNNYLWFSRGDVMTIGYRLRGFGYVFTGLCARVRSKAMLSPSSTFMLRNIFAKIAVELYATLYGLSRLNFKFLDYAKKKFNYRSAKLYYLRDKVNIESWVR